MSTDPRKGLACLTVTVSEFGKYGYRIEGDRLGKYQILSVLQLVQREIVDEVYNGVRPTKIPIRPEQDKTAQDSAEIDDHSREVYNGEVPLPKHEAMSRYYGAMEKLRDRILAIEKQPSDEIFLVPEELLREL